MKEKKGPDNRYLDAHKTIQENALFPSTPGICIWCGNPTPKPGQKFCPGIVVPGSSMRLYQCMREFMDWWLKIPRFKRVVYVRDNFTCQNCHLRPTFKNSHGVELPDLKRLACDHIIPFSKGGKTELKNLQTLCRVCNSKKSNKMDWQQGVMRDESGQPL